MATLTELRIEDHGKTFMAAFVDAKPVQFRGTADQLAKLVGYVDPPAVPTDLSAAPPPTDPSHEG